MKHNDELTDYQLKKVLHEPLAPYVANVYNTLIHLVQGLALAALFYVISIQEQFTPVIIINLIICFGYIITIWHGNIINNQYNVMRPTIFDTLIPIVLAVFQSILALSVNQPFYIFNLILIIIIFTVDIQFLNSYRKSRKPLALEVFKEHFKRLDLQFAQDLYIEFRNFEKNVITKIIMFAIFFIILTIVLYFLPLNVEFKIYISSIAIAIFLILGSYNDLNHWFNNSDKLKKYGYEW